jgi:hypothetical protein
MLIPMLPDLILIVDRTSTGRGNWAWGMGMGNFSFINNLNLKPIDSRYVKKD